MKNRRTHTHTHITGQPFRLHVRFQFRGDFQLSLFRLFHSLSRSAKWRAKNTKHNTSDVISFRRIETNFLTSLLSSQLLCVCNKFRKIFLVFFTLCRTPWRVFVFTLLFYAVSFPVQQQKKGARSTHTPENCHSFSRIIRLAISQSISIPSFVMAFPSSALFLSLSNSCYSARKVENRMTNRDKVYRLCSQMYENCTERTIAWHRNGNEHFHRVQGRNQPGKVEKRNREGVAVDFREIFLSPEGR